MEQVGIYTLYKLGRVGENLFSLDYKTKERDLHSVHHDYANSVNETSEISGFYYELDTKATKLYHDKKPFKQVKEYVEFEEIKDNAQEPKQIVLEGKKESANLELEVLRNKYFELSGKAHKPLWGVKKLTEEINNLTGN